MSRTGNGAVLMVFSMVCLLTLSACSTNRRADETPANNQPPANNQTQQAVKPVEGTTPAETANPAQEGSALSVGQASGSYTSKGETVELKYAYAGRGKRFGQGHESIIVLLTDKPIPAEAVAAEIKSQDMLFDQKIRGLEYVIQPNNESHWVCFHPTQYQESKSGSPLEDFSVGQETIRGRDENDGRISDGKYKCSVRFVAAIVK